MSCTILQLEMVAQAGTIDDAAIETIDDDDHHWGRGAGGPGEYS